MIDKPILSVCLITYNHKKFIAQSIESVLNQKINFVFELIIADDFSTDGTTEIVQKYAHDYPNVIRQLSRTKNIGPAENFIELLASATGKYIAYIEGDDYWSDPLKLQKQVDFLEANEAYVGCFHNSEERYHDDYTKASTLYLSWKSGRAVSIQEFALANVCPSASIVFRSPVPPEIFTDTYKNLPLGDWPLHLLNIRRGDYYYLPQVMSARNLHTGGTWSLQDGTQNIAKTISCCNTLIESNWFEEQWNLNLGRGKKELEETLGALQGNVMLKVKRRLKWYSNIFSSKILARKKV
jgi:glycosyltransferase involved in cell wall biosynthesis